MATTESMGNKMFPANKKNINDNLSEIIDNENVDQMDRNNAAYKRS